MRKLVIAIPILLAAVNAGAGEAPLTVHCVHGLYHRMYRVEEAIALLGGAIASESWHWDGTGSGWLSPSAESEGGLAWYDGTPEWLASQRIVIAANIPAKAFGKGQQALADYVLNGGALLLLGGNCMATKQYMNSPLKDILPMEFKGEGRWAADLASDPAGLVLAPGPDAPAEFAALKWDAGPRVFWYHDGTPRDGSQVLLAAGGKPLLVSRAAGKGRVALFAGTLLGMQGERQTAFWQWQQWPEVLAAVMGQLAGPRRQNVARPAAAGDAAALRAKLAELAPEGAFKPKAYLDVLTDQHKTYQEALIGLLLAGDAKAAPDAVAALLDDLYLISRARTELNKSKERLERVHKTIPDALAWQQEMYRKLNGAPESVSTALAQAVAAQKDRRIEAIAWAAFAGRTLTPEEKQILGRSEVPSVRALAR